MNCGIDNPQVTAAVVGFIMIPMVDNFRFFKRATKCAAHDVAMFGDVAILLCVRVRGLINVKIPFAESAAFVSGMAFSASKKKGASPRAALSTSLDSGWKSFKRFFTEPTDYFNHNYIIHKTGEAVNVS